MPFDILRFPFDILRFKPALPFMLIPYHVNGYGWSEAAQDWATVVPKVRSRLDHRTRCDVLAVDAGAWLRIWRIPPIKPPVAGSVFLGD